MEKFFTDNGHQAKKLKTSHPPLREIPPITSEAAASQVGPSGKQYVMDKFLTSLPDRSREGSSASATNESFPEKHFKMMKSLNLERLPKSANRSLFSAEMRSKLERILKYHNRPESEKDSHDDINSDAANAWKEIAIGATNYSWDRIETKDFFEERVAYNELRGKAVQETITEQQKKICDEVLRNIKWKSIAKPLDKQKVQEYEEDENVTDKQKQAYAEMRLRVLDLYSFHRFGYREATRLCLQHLISRVDEIVDHPGEQSELERFVTESFEALSDSIERLKKGKEPLSDDLSDVPVRLPEPQNIEGSSRANSQRASSESPLSELDCEEVLEPDWYKGSHSGDQHPDQSQQYTSQPDTYEHPMERLNPDTLQKALKDNTLWVTIRSKVERILTYRELSLENREALDEDAAISRDAANAWEEIGIEIESKSTWDHIGDKDFWSNRAAYNELRVPAVQDTMAQQQKEDFDEVLKSIDWKSIQKLLGATRIQKYYEKNESIPDEQKRAYVELLLRVGDLHFFHMDGYHMDGHQAAARLCLYHLIRRADEIEKHLDKQRELECDVIKSFKSLSDSLQSLKGKEPLSDDLSAVPEYTGEAAKAIEKARWWKIEDVRPDVNFKLMPLDGSGILTLEMINEYSSEVLTACYESSARKGLQEFVDKQGIPEGHKDLFRRALRTLENPQAEKEMKEIFRWYRPHEIGTLCSCVRAYGTKEELITYNQANNAYGIQPRVLRNLNSKRVRKLIEKKGREHIEPCHNTNTKYILGTKDENAAIDAKKVTVSNIFNHSNLPDKLHVIIDDKNNLYITDSDQQLSIDEYPSKSTIGNKKKNRAPGWHFYEIDLSFS